MSGVLEKNLLEAEGKNKEEISPTNPFREIGFDKDKNRLGWVRVLPFQKIKESLENVLDIVNDKENFIFIGMGGSINGIKALLSLFKDRSIYTLDNLDPLAIKNLAGKVKNFQRTLVIPVSKSGTTKETQLLSCILKELLINSAVGNTLAGEEWKKHFLWLADADSFGKLDSLGWQGVKKVAIQFDGKDDIGGRFSCPYTLLFALPLFLLLHQDFQKIEGIYSSYLSFQEKIRERADYFSEKYKDRSNAYFYPVIKGVSKECFSSWIVQLLGESLGSKKKDFCVKTLLSGKRNKDFLPLSLNLKIEEPVVNLMCQMYFYQIFVAFYASFKVINFVNQDFVEEYKNQMRKIEGEKNEDIAVLNFSQLIEKVKEEVNPVRELHSLTVSADGGISASSKGRFASGEKPSSAFISLPQTSPVAFSNGVNKAGYPFIDIILYFYPPKKIIKLIKNTFSESFPDRQISLFIGSDWNHHSYQAAYEDKNTFYVLLLSLLYKEKLKFISPQTIKKNIEVTKLISKATQLTLGNKSILTRIDLTTS